jgi:leader peptidase (prepilin peptidase)/N-methyltransferase
VAGLLLWLHPSRQLGFWVGLVLLIFLGIVFVIDVKHRLVLHPTSIAGAILGLVVGIWKHGLLATVGGGVAGFLIMLGLYYLGDWYARWLARRRGQEFTDVALGFGDVNLSGIMGLLLGWPGVIVGLISAILLGGIFSLFYMLGAVLLRKYQHFMAIPYAPFLVLAVILFLYII